jgi:transposase
MAGKKGMRHYSKEVKLQAVQMFLGGGKTYAEITEELGIRDPQRIEKWVRLYRQEGELGLSKPKGRPRKRQDEQSELEYLRMENVLLKKFHAELRKQELAKRNIG